MRLSKKVLNIKFSFNNNQIVKAGKRKPQRTESPLSGVCTFLQAGWCQPISDHLLDCKPTVQFCTAVRVYCRWGWENNRVGSFTLLIQLSQWTEITYTQIWKVICKVYFHRNIQELWNESDGFQVSLEDSDLDFTFCWNDNLFLASTANYYIG